MGIGFHIFSHTHGSCVLSLLDRVNISSKDPEAKAVGNFGVPPVNLNPGSPKSPRAYPRLSDRCERATVESDLTHYSGMIRQ